MIRPMKCQGFRELYKTRAILFYLNIIIIIIIIIIIMIILSLGIAPFPYKHVLCFRIMATLVNETSEVRTVIDGNKPVTFFAPPDDVILKYPISQRLKLLTQHSLRAKVSGLYVCPGMPGCVVEKSSVNIH